MHRGFCKIAILTVSIIALGLGSSFAQTLKSDIDLGRNRVGSSIYNGVSGSGESYSVVGGGNDISDNIDEFHYRYTEICGDFDVRALPALNQRQKHRRTFRRCD